LIGSKVTRFCGRTVVAHGHWGIQVPAIGKIHKYFLECFPFAQSFCSVDFFDFEKDVGGWCVSLLNGPAASIGPFDLLQSRVSQDFREKIDLFCVSSVSKFENLVLKVSRNSASHLE
jgi:hypothetical protein